MGFLFASIFSAAISPVTMQLFGGHPLPRFNDVFLLGIVLTAYFFTWESAAYLLVISILVSAWVLPPYGSFWIEGATEWYRLASFTLLSVFLILLITRMKARQPAEPVEERQQDHESVRSMAVGD
jgi:K+-sensing histidine kinase KdpD